MQKEQLDIMLKSLFLLYYYRMSTWTLCRAPAPRCPGLDHAHTAGAGAGWPGLIGRSPPKHCSQVTKHSNIQTFKHSNIQTFKHSNIQTFKHSNIQKFKHSNMYSPHTISEGGGVSKSVSDSEDLGERRGGQHSSGV